MHCDLADTLAEQELEVPSARREARSGELLDTIRAMAALPFNDNLDL